MIDVERRLKRILLKSSMLQKAVYHYQERRIRSFIHKIEPYLQEHGCRKILDLGPNTCVLSEALVALGYRVYPLDICDWSISSVKPILYSGSEIPFSSHFFDCGLAISMLHHVDNQDALLQELGRTCKWIVLQEDLLSGFPRDQWMYLWDSLVNLEFMNHPRTNHSDEEWREKFEKMGLVCLNVDYYTWQWIRFGIYLLKAGGS